MHIYSNINLHIDLLYDQTIRHDKKKNIDLYFTLSQNKTRIKINKAKATFTGRGPRTLKKPRADIRVKGVGHVM
jgi:hypothetical protein